MATPLLGRRIFALATLLCCSPQALAGKKDKDNADRVAVPQVIGPSVSPPTNVFLRNSFDTDPSRYLGRFVPDGMTVLDEANSSKTQCSQFVVWEKVGGGGVVHDELFRVSDSAAGSLGIPPFLSASGGGESMKMVRIRYTSAAKMVSDIEDVAGFEACCKQAGDQCTDRYVGEFLEGTGEIWYAVGSAADFQAGGMGNSVTGEIEVKHDLAWQRGLQFPNPVYFGFKTHDNQFGSDSATVATGGCGDWTQAPPKSSQGMYFVGVSEYLDSERAARDMALRDARVQTVRWLGESITTGAAEFSGFGGSAGNLGLQLEQEAFLDTAASGVATMVKDEAWCLEEEATPRGVRTQAKVLAFLPKGQYAAAAGVVVGGAR